MKASEIVTKIKDVLLSTNSEEVNTPDVELKDEAPKAKKPAKVEAKEAKEETPKAEVKQVTYSAEEEYQEEAELMPEEAPVMEYATKDEVAELKSMVEKLRGMIESKEEAREEIPQELSSEEPVEAISHSPENEVGEKMGTRYAVNANQNTTYNRVLNAISNN